MWCKHTYEGESLTVDTEEAASNVLLAYTLCRFCLSEAREIFISGSLHVSCIDSPMVVFAMSRYSIPRGLCVSLGIKMKRLCMQDHHEE